MVRIYGNEINTFEDLLEIVPTDITNILNKMKSMRENPAWHPEASAYEHVKIVTERAISTGDINLVIGALFHDLGKEATRAPSKKGEFETSFGHEKISAELVEKYPLWITTVGAKPEIVYEIVNQHMRMHRINDMKPSKQATLRSNPHFDRISKFAQMDSMINRRKM
jgi:HD superfamily phosphodiesterase